MNTNELRAVIVICATALAIHWDSGMPLWLIVLAVW